MTPKTNFYALIEDYYLCRLDEIERVEFEAELEHNQELANEVNLNMEIQSAITEKDVLNLREQLESIVEENRNRSKEYNDSFELLDEFATINEIIENVRPEELINYYDSLPKVHVYQHELVSNENLYQYYKEQNRKEIEIEDDSLNFELEDLEGLEEAIMEKDILSFRDSLTQVAKSLKPQFSTKDIDNYLNGEFKGKELELFETELENNSALKKEVQLHIEMEESINESDILVLRNQLSNIIETETSWKVSEECIEDFIDGILEGEKLRSFTQELNENIDLRAEVDLRNKVNEALGEKDIFSLRNKLNSARDKIEGTETKSIMPDVKIGVIKFWKRAVAVMLLLVGISGILNFGLKSIDSTYDQFYQSAEWSPERSVTPEVGVLVEANQYYSNKEFSKALDLYNLAIVEYDNKKKFVFDFYKASCLQNLNRFNEAIIEYNAVIKHGGNYFVQEAEWNKSLCYLKIGNKEMARTQLVAIVNKNGYYGKNANTVLRRLKYSIK